MQLDSTLEVGLLIYSVDVPQLQPVTAAIKTLAKDKISWEAVTSRLIEEQKALVNEGGKPGRVNSAKTGCDICKKRNHTTDTCLLNPLFE